MPPAPAVTGRAEWPVGDLARLTRLLAAGLPDQLRAQAVHDPAERQAGADAWLVIICNEGFASSLAADSLRRLGVPRSTDLDGGFRAWAAAGLPTIPGGSPALP